MRKKYFSKIYNYSKNALVFLNTQKNGLLPNGPEFSDCSELGDVRKRTRTGKILSLKDALLRKV